MLYHHLLFLNISHLDPPPPSGPGSYELIRDNFGKILSIKSGLSDRGVTLARLFALLTLGANVIKIFTVIIYDFS